MHSIFTKFIDLNGSLETGGVTSTVKSDGKANRSLSVFPSR